MGTDWVYDVYYVQFQNTDCFQGSTKVGGNTILYEHMYTMQRIEINIAE